MENAKTINQPLIDSLVEAGRLDFAQSLIRSFLKTMPENSAVRLAAADVYRAMGDLATCQEQLRAILPGTEEFPKASRLLALIAQQSSTSHTLAARTHPVPFTRMENVLPPEEVAQLTDFVLANRGRFRPSKVKAAGHVNAQARRSLVWQKVSDIPSSLTARVLAAISDNACRLGVTATLNQKMEIEISAYGDGDFVAPHWDRGDGITSGRRVTTLFYFHALPVRFSGGQLQLFDTGSNGEFDRARWTGFAPSYNSMLQFQSQAMHAVSQVNGPQNFADSRFCLTCWAWEKR